MFLFFSYSKRPFRRHHHRSRVCRHTTWPYQYTWAWHWTHPLDRQICFPDKLWPYNCSHLFHQYSPEYSDPKVRIPFRNCLVQVNLFQKLSFLNQLTRLQLTHNMTRAYSLNSPKNTSSQHVVYKYCFECQTKTKPFFVHIML